MAERRRRRKASDNSLGISIGTVDRPYADPALEEIYRADESRQQQVEDEQAGFNNSGATIIEPLYSFALIDRVYKQSNMLPQCINAMVTNIAGNGYRVVGIDPEKIPVDPAEEDLLLSFIERANVDQSLMQVARHNIFQYEKYGLEMYEVVRDRASKPTLLKSVNISTMRCTARDADPIPVTRTVKRANGERVSVVERKRFRKYVQRIGKNWVWFKEFGDPRVMDLRTGEYKAKSRIAEANRATEILHFKQESEDVYGLPRWISQLPSILGSREAENVNVRYFQDNTIPPAIITISGGRLTRDSFLEIKKTIEQGGIGKQNLLMLLEAIPETEGLDDAGVAQIKLEKLTDARPSDGLFKEYDDANMAKIRSAFRLPPVILGMSQDVTFATANVSAFLAEMQVFEPERKVHDEYMNKRFVNNEMGLNLKTVKLESRGPQLTQPENVVKALTAANAMGAITPRGAIDILNEHLQISIPQYPEPEGEMAGQYFPWMDQPLQFSLREIGRNDNDVERTREEEDMDEEGSEERESAREGETGPGSDRNE